MNDRLKFRAHFPKKHGIMQSKQIHYLAGFWEIKSVVGDNLIGFETIDGNRASCYSDDIIIMQCTGLKDKHGKLIFEGDIARSDEYPFNSKGDDNYYAEICFDPDSASCFYYPIKNPKLNKVRGASVGMAGQINEHIFEVIGNIYATPELEVSE